MVDFLKRDIRLHQLQLEAYRRQTRRLWIITAGLTLLLVASIVLSLKAVQSITESNRQIVAAAIAMRRGENPKPGAINPQKPPRDIFNVLKIAQNWPSKP